MNVVTFVSLCSIGVDPTPMHALVWHQSGGEHWSFTVPGEGDPRVLSKESDAVAEAHAFHATAAIRIGLTGLSTTPSAVTTTMLLPCPNIATTARQIVQLRTRCEANERSDLDPIFCAVAAYRGSWERSDTRFASPFVHLLPVAARRISTCRGRPASRSVRWCSTCRRQHRRLLRPGRMSLPTITTADGEADCSR